MTEPVVRDETCATVRAGTRAHPTPVSRRVDSFPISKVKSGTRAMGRPSITAPGGNRRALTQVSAGRTVSSRHRPPSGRLKGVRR